MRCARRASTWPSRTSWTGRSSAEEIVIDCRGLAARGELAGLRGVRGERVVVRAREVELVRPVRLLHPRHPLYVVPWGDGRYMVGATVIESDDEGPVTVRSALELLGSAYALHPGFARGRDRRLGAGVRPAFADNVPKIVVRGRTIHVNGLYRHGFLLAPVLAELVADYLATGAIDERVFRVERRASFRPGHIPAEVHPRDQTNRHRQRQDAAGLPLPARRAGGPQLRPRRSAPT